MRHLLFAILLLLPLQAGAQTITTDLNAKVEGWVQDDRCYQHQLAADATVGLEWGRLTARSWMSMTWWGACDAKLPGNLLNAESGKVLQRGHGVQILVWPVSWVGVGARIERDAVHHIWRHKDRHDHFPANKSVGVRACNGGDAPSWPSHLPQCPSIGYWDAVGPVLTIKLPRMSFRFDAPILHWKDLTLPSPAFRWKVTAFSGFAPYFISQGEINEDGSANQVFEVGYQITPSIRFGVSAGTVGVPGWKSDLSRFAFVVRAD